MVPLSTLAIFLSAFLQRLKGEGGGFLSFQGFVVAYRLSKAIIKRKSILKTTALLAKHFIVSQPTPNILKYLNPLYNLILQKLKHAYLYSPGVKSLVVSTIRALDKYTQTMKAGYGVNLPVVSIVSNT